LTQSPGTLRLEYVDPSTLGPNPSNWRTHPEGQRAALAQAIDQVGWVKPLIFNARTGLLIDGHMRREDAIRRGCAVPVVIGEWDESQERTILATLDPIGLMAEADSGLFAALLEQLDTVGPDLMGLISATADAMGLYKGMDDASTDDVVSDHDEAPEESDPVGEPEPTDGVPDAIFPSDNELGIPTLDLRMQAAACVFPLTTWGTIAGNRAMPGTWLFYIDDYRFEPLWKDPAKALRAGAVNAAEINFSTHEQHPKAYAIWQTYRKRWVARYWQTQGVRILVDLNVHESFRDVNLIGVPKGWKAYANRAHNRGDGLEAEHAIACEHAGTDEILYLVYGGGKAVKELCAARSWNWAPEQYDVAKANLKAKKEADNGQK